MKPNVDRVRAHYKRLAGYYAIRFFLWFVWIALTVLLWKLWADAYFTDRMNRGSSLALAGVVGSIPFFGFRLWRVFTNRYFEGTVTDLQHKRQVKSISLVTHREDLRYYYPLWLMIRTDRGRWVEKELDYGSPRYAEPYRIGDRVRYYPGTAFPQIITDDPERKVNCVFCGADLEPGEDHCRLCRKPLLP